MERGSRMERGEETMPVRLGWRKGESEGRKRGKANEKGEEYEGAMEKRQWGGESCVLRI